MKETVDSKIVILGVNAAGILTKIDSFDKWIKDKKPAIFVIQESKVPQKGKIESNQLIGFQQYELIRSQNPNLGGGLCIGITKDLHSVQVREGDDECECLTVEVTISNQQQMVVVAGYGPQVTDCPERKNKFWAYLDREVEEAERDNKMIVIQMDSNSWASSEIIPNDPNMINSNGKLFKLFLERHKKLTVVNSVPLCEGLITRQRKTKVLDEKSVLDVFVVCERTIPFVSKMKVVEAREYPLTNFHGLKNGQKITESDHNGVELHMQISAPVIKSQRMTLFNFRQSEGQAMFHYLTSNTTKLSNCFKTNEIFDIQSKHFFKNLNGFFHRSFKKVRGKKGKIEESEVEVLLQERKRMRKIMKEDQSDEAEKKLVEIETKVGKLV